MRTEVEMSRSDLTSPVHTTMDESYLEFADDVSESDIGYLPLTVSLPSNTDYTPSPSPFSLDNDSTTTSPFLGCPNTGRPDPNHVPKNDGIFERNVQKQYQSLNCGRNRVHSINPAGVQLKLDCPHSTFENNNNNNSNHNGNFKLGLTYPKGRNCAPVVCPFVKPDALCDNVAVNNGQDNGISLRHRESSVTAVQNNLNAVSYLSKAAGATRRSGLTHQNAVQCEQGADTTMACQPGADICQTSDESSSHAPHGKTSPLFRSAQPLHDLHTMSTVSENIPRESRESCVTTRSDHPAYSLNNTTSYFTGIQPERSSSCDSESLVLGDGVSTDTDEALRRISFTLSFGSDGSSSGTDVQVKSAGSTGGQVDKGGHGRTNKLSYNNTNKCPMSPTLNQSAAAEFKFNRSERSQRPREVKEGKGTLTLRISRSLSSFLKKTPPKSLTLTDVSSTVKDTEQTTSPEDDQPYKSSLKKPKRQMSLAERVMTSLAKLGRRGPSEALDDDEYFDNNKNTPVFVAPGDQVDVVDKVPSLLTHEQCRILKDSWFVIKNDVTEVGVETFMGLFNTHPDAIDSFLAFKDKTVQDLERSAVLKAHALRVMQTVDKCISRLDKLDKMAALLMQLGRRHVGYQANIKLIPIIGRQFVAAIEPKMASSWSREMKAAWEGLFAIINYHMRLGIMDEKNKRIKAAAEAEASRKKQEVKKKRDKPR